MFPEIISTHRFIKQITVKTASAALCGHHTGKVWNATATFPTFPFCCIRQNNKGLCLPEMLGWRSIMKKQAHVPLEAMACLSWPRVLRKVACAGFPGDGELNAAELVCSHTTAACPDRDAHWCACVRPGKWWLWVRRRALPWAGGTWRAAVVATQHCHGGDGTRRCQAQARGSAHPP